MPLIAITNHPRHRILFDGRHERYPLSVEMTRKAIRSRFGPTLPELIVKHAGSLRLDDGTPPEAVQVTHTEFSLEDVNTPDVWIQVTLAEHYPNTSGALGIRNTLYRILMDQFEHLRMHPQSVVLDVFWGPSHGRGVVNGVRIDW